MIERFCLRSKFMALQQEEFKGQDSWKLEKSTSILNILVAHLEEAIGSGKTIPERNLKTSLPSPHRSQLQKAVPMFQKSSQQ